MTTDWERYGLLAKVVADAKARGASLGKTKLQKLVYLLKELKGVDAGYTFHFYTYGPYSQTLAGDMNYLSHINGLRVSYDANMQGYEIEPGEEAAKLLERTGPTFAEKDRQIKEVLDDFSNKYAKDLELLSAIVYVYRSEADKAKEEGFLVSRIKELKPKFPDHTIRAAIKELSEKHYLMNAA